MPGPFVLAVDEASLAIGEPVSLLKAHAAPGQCHLAVSVQLVDLDGRWLLQRRAPGKPLFGGLWANTCCTHPRPAESNLGAATRRLGEELGIVGISLMPAGAFVYRAADEQSGLVEHEWDHVFVGHADLWSMAPDPLEVAEVALVDPDEIDGLIAAGSTAPWFPTVAAHAGRATGAQ